MKNAYHSAVRLLCFAFGRCGYHLWLFGLGIRVTVVAITRVRTVLLGLCRLRVTY